MATEHEPGRSTDDRSPPAGTAPAEADTRHPAGTETGAPAHGQPAAPPAAAPPPSPPRPIAVARLRANLKAGARRASRGAWRCLCAFPRWAGHARNLIADILLTVVLVALAYVSWRTLNERDLAIHPFTVPEAFAKFGYTGDVAAARLRESLLALQEYQGEDARLLGGEMILPVTAEDRRAQGVPNVEVHGVGLSFSQLILQLREALNLRTRRINGELIFERDGLCLNLRYIDAPGRGNLQRISLCSPDRDRPDRLIERGAQLVILDISPEFALRYPPNGRSAEVGNYINALAARLGRSTDRDDRALSYEISGLNHWYRSGEGSYAIREIERAVALSPNSRRVLTLALFRYFRSIRDLRRKVDETSGIREDTRRDDQLDRVAAEVHAERKRIIEALDTAGRKHRLRDRNFEAFSGALAFFFARLEIRIARKLTAADKREQLEKRARKEVSDALERLESANRAFAFDHALIVQAADDLGRVDDVRAVCRRIDGLVPTSVAAVICQDRFYRWKMLAHAKEKAAAPADEIGLAKAHGNVLDRFLENLAFHLPRERMNDNPENIGLRQQVAAYRLRESRMEFYRALFTFVDLDEIRTIGRFGVAAKHHDLLLMAPAAAEPRLARRKINLWFLSELECLVHTLEDDSALADTLARSFKESGLTVSGEYFSLLAAALEVSRSVTLRHSLHGSMIRLGLAEIRTNLRGWRDLRCGHMMGWRRHGTVQDLPLGVGE